ncbi:hypothetical protein [Kineococcus sp. SYSU DK005]|uniref:hypothetical protein n=1 Tax=Kineococcus sp. SYSU DK005 TaxID=3383126 RepID=UPI003D7E8215
MEVLDRARGEWVSVAEIVSIAREQGAACSFEAAVACALALAEQRLVRLGRYVQGAGFSAWPQRGPELAQRLRGELAESPAHDPLQAQSDIMIDAV